MRRALAGVFLVATWLTGACGCATDGSKDLKDKAAGPVQQTPPSGQSKEQVTLPNGRPIPPEARFGAYAPEPGPWAAPGSVSPGNWR